MALDKNFTRQLLVWYRKNARDLPWRRTQDPYKIWISEIMLQQTTVNAVIPYYERWVKTFPTLKHVAKASEQKILKAWQGLGYYQRARNIHKAARLVVKNFNGKIPSDLEKLKTLPGFGSYTLAAVSSIAFNKALPLVDANVRRVMMRILALEEIITPAVDGKVLPFLSDTISQREPGNYNQALMELGALICKSKEPLCLLCPVQTHCQAFKKGNQGQIPLSKKKVVQDLNVAIGILRLDGKFFIQQRPPQGLLANLWEFPGGKIEKGETPEQALRREIREELGIKITRSKHLMNVRHFYTTFRVNLHVSECQAESYPSEDSTHRWVTRRDIEKFPMPSGTVKIISKLT